MRTYQVTQREGERMGDIDWGFDFCSMISCWGGSPAWIEERLFREFYNLWMVERAHKKGLQGRVTEGQFAHDLIDVGMYDGWPYWKPIPSVFVSSVLGGGQWRQFPCVDDWRVTGPQPECSQEETVSQP